MQMRNWACVAVLTAITAGAAAAVGCGQADLSNSVEKKADKRPQGDSKHNYAGRDWCREHGVPESECTRCHPQLVAKFKEKGDWCKKHDRPDSQCFLCHPEKEAEFAADYEAKYGEKPPKPDPETPDDESKS